MKDEIKIEDYLPMIHKIAKQYRNLLADRAWEHEDIVSECLMAFVKCRNWWKEGKIPDNVKFSTALHQIIKSRLNRKFREQRQIKRQTNLNTVDEDIETISNHANFSEKIAMMTDEAIEIIKIIYNTPQEFIEIGEMSITNMKKFLKKYRGWSSRKISLFFKK